MNEATRQYVLAHADDDVRQLALQGSRDAAVDLRMALQQIQGRQTARRKLPSWAAHDDMLYPAHLSMEQCSSEQTARYKARVACDSVASIIPPVTSRLVDLTGGLGVDFAFMAPVFHEAVYVEQQPELSAIAQANFATLGLTVTTICGDGIGYLHQLDKATLIFLDPARRDGHGGRTYGISDCTPNVLTILEELLSKADHVMIKLSPMLDWRKAVSDVGAEHVEQIHIISVGNECKELLLVISAKGCECPRLICKNDNSTEVFPLNPTTPTSPTIPTTPTIPTPPSLLYLYEPNSSLMKAGLFVELAARYGLSPLAPNSHLFTSEEYIAHFPGRIFQIAAVSSMNKQELKATIQPLRQANISVRNFPLSVAELRKRLKLTEGGSNYLFATTLGNGNHIILVGKKITP